LSSIYGSFAPGCSGVQSCSWVIQNPNGEHIELFLTEQYLSEDGVIVIYDGDTTNATVVATATSLTTGVPPVISSGNSLTVSYTSGTGLSDMEVVYVAGACPSVIVPISSPYGAFSDGSGSQSYPAVANCSWLINLDAGPLVPITLTVTYCSFEYEYDYLYP
jgi:hypothetical protein